MNHFRNGILISGGGFRNKGAEAMLLTVVDAVRARCPSEEVRPAILYGKGSEGRPRLADRPGNEGLWGLSLAKVKAMPFHVRLRALINISGYSIGDPWGISPVKGALRSARRARLVGGKCFFLPQAWGPFSGPDMRDMVRRLVRLCDLCYARDRVSFSALLETAGEDAEAKIRMAPDIAWNFVGETADTGRRLIMGSGLQDPAGKQTVCVTPNLRVYERAQGSSSRNDYVRLMASLIEHMCRRWDAQVVLVGHELADDNRRVPDDRVLCEMVQQLVDSSLPVGHVNRCLSAREVKSIIGGCRFVLSSRFHALIAAMSQHIPAATIGWSHKYPELMEEAGCAANVLDTTQPLAKVVERLDAIMASREEQQQILGMRVPDIKKRAAEAVDTVMTRLFGESGVCL